MTVQVEYNSYHLRKITRTGAEGIELPPGSTIRRLLEVLSAKYGEPFKADVVSAQGGALKILLMVDGTSVSDLDRTLSQGNKANFVLRATGG
jgi:hypothetical protein